MTFRQIYDRIIVLRKKEERKMKLSLIIPCYNEEGSLTPLYNELIRVSKEMSSYDFEYIFVDDGSKDKTLEIIKDLAKNDERITYIAFSKNFGKESAMYAGFCNATGDYVAVMDADMQDPPALLPKMVEILESGEYDSVATRRVDRKGEPPVRSLFANIFYMLFKRVSNVSIVSGARDFRLMKREMVDAIVAMCEHNRFSKGIFGWIGFKTYWLPFENVERVAGQSKWSFWKLFKYSFDGICAFSDKLLYLPFYLSLFLALVSTAPLAYFIYFCATFGFWMGYPALACSLILFTILAIGTLLFLCLGILGAYVSKIHGDTKGRPHYIVAQTNKKDVVRK